MGGGVSGRGSGSGSRSSRVNWDKQNKHEKKSRHYVKGKSYTTIPRDSIQNFIDKHLTTAQKISDGKYRVHSNEVIGMYIDKHGVAHPSTNAIIVLSKTGSHVYPVRPDGFIED